MVSKSGMVPILDWLNTQLFFHMRLYMTDFKILNASYLTNWKWVSTAECIPMKNYTMKLILISSDRLYERKKKPNLNLSIFLWWKAITKIF